MSRTRQSRGSHATPAATATARVVKATSILYMPRPYRPTMAREIGSDTDGMYDAIASSDGTRASVAAKLTAATAHRTVLGAIGFDAHGEHGRGAAAESLRPTVALLHAVR